jgi:hypothetical protein
MSDKQNDEVVTPPSVDLMSADMSFPDQVRADIEALLEQANIEMGRTPAAGQEQTNKRD